VVVRSIPSLTVLFRRLVRGYVNLTTTEGGGRRQMARSQRADDLRVAPLRSRPHRAARERGTIFLNAHELTHIDWFRPESLCAQHWLRRAPLEA